MQQISTPDLHFLIVVLAALSLAPFVVVMVTSFVKLVVVFSLIRNALGIQQIPPNIVINGLAIILSIYIMAPIGQDMLDRAAGVQLDQKNVGSLKTAIEQVKDPLQGFMMKHSSEKERQFFLKSAKKLWPADRTGNLKQDDLLILVPAFVASELTSAFQIGFLLYLPFIAIDLVIANILMAMGMMMVSPMTISLPFKLLLFVLLDGWTRLLHGLVLTYY
jgi:type III secretion protein R